MRSGGCYSSQGDELWLLANATVYEAREVSAEFNRRAARFYELLKAIQFAFAVATIVMPALRRLIAKQSKLITKLDAANQGRWDQDGCQEMSLLLQELIRDEGNFIENGWDYMKPGGVLVARYLDTLRCQLVQLEKHAVHLDALSVPVKEMPGDADCQGFMALLAGPEEYDFSTDPGPRRRVHSHI